jgi:hypothetical protein
VCSKYVYSVRIAPAKKEACYDTRTGTAHRSPGTYHYAGCRDEDATARNASSWIRRQTGCRSGFITHCAACCGIDAFLAQARRCSDSAGGNPDAGFVHDTAIAADLLDHTSYQASLVRLVRGPFFYSFLHHLLHCKFIVY